MIDKQGDFIFRRVTLARLNRKFGFVAKDNKVRHEFIFDSADSFEGGKAKVTINNQVTFIES